MLSFFCPYSRRRMSYVQLSCACTVGVECHMFSIFVPYSRRHMQCDELKKCIAEGEFFATYASRCIPRFRQCCSSYDHSVRYRGSNEVWEGDPFEVSCVVTFSDREGWTINSSIAITDDNDLGYSLSEREVDTFREELTLAVHSAQLFHEGEYRCNRDSRDFHYVRIIPALAGVHERGPKKEAPPPKATNEYVLEINKTIEFYCSSAKYDNTPVTWYKNSRRIVENSESNILIAGLSLLIENAQEDDAGEYMCTVDTPFVTGYTDIGRIFRLNSPAKILDFPKKESIIKGRSLNLHCRAQGFPPPKITWYIGNLMASQLKEADLRISIYSADGGMSNSYLILRDMTVSDKGLYTCRAENSIDSGITTSYDEESVFVHVRGN
ncbi:hypothetical protein AVEN_131614-1 [Araneus ventricosus]|uniref:Ig-like domain-containing protein n=1 Tax=Araneus ventricosus TaxID=182803 RepID=A0A4Y2EWE0_ARAVE|nr:hypothetical protein AVEN_131614-1 [Araneus ventricosus]